MTTSYLFAVGSLNPVKIASVQVAITQFWPTAQTQSCNTLSHVSEQPQSDEEMVIGAINRARHALQLLPTADFGVGIEGGIVDVNESQALTPALVSMWALAWVAIVSRSKEVGQAEQIGLGQTARFSLPPGVATLVRSGLELGAADDQFFGQANSKQKAGAIGLLSAGRLDRQQLYQQGVTCALLRFVHPEYYMSDD